LFSPTGYIGEFEIVDDHRSGKIVVNLTGRLNKCGVISPRFDVPINDIEKWTNNLLPSRQFGYVVTLTYLNYLLCLGSFCSTILHKSIVPIYLSWKENSNNSDNKEKDNQINEPLCKLNRLRQPLKINNDDFL